MATSTAFTLAEVLIVLTIIGVVAAMTIPAISANTHKAELKAGLKTAYSTLSQAVNRMATDEGGQLLATYNGCAYNENGGCFKPVFMKYFVNMKDCKASSCVVSTASSTVYKIYSKSSGIDTGMIDNGQYIPATGMTIFTQNSEDKSLGILISVDVNGYKNGPNIWGHDLFTFELMSDDTLKPCGAPGTGKLGYFATGLAENQSTYCSKTSSNAFNGVGCTAQALSDDSYWDDLP